MIHCSHEACTTTSSKRARDQRHHSRRPPLPSLLAREVVCGWTILTRDTAFPASLRLCKARLSCSNIVGGSARGSLVRSLLVLATLMPRRRVVLVLSSPPGEGAPGQRAATRERLRDRWRHRAAPGGGALVTVMYVPSARSHTLLCIICTSASLRGLQSIGQHMRA